MRLGARTPETFGPPEDHTWIASSTGTNDWQTIILDKDLFTAIYADKVVKSGTVLAKVTATGRYGPADSTASDGRELTTDIYILGATTDVSFEHSPVAGMWHGAVWQSKLPRQSGAGSLTSGIKTALAGRIHVRP